MKNTKIIIKASSKSYPVYFGNGIINLTGASVGTKQGFSIVQFNSQSSNGDFTVPHGLNNAPNLILMKSQTRTGGPWWIYQSSTTTAVDLYLAFTDAATTDNTAAGGGNIWGSSLPSSTTFGFTTGAGCAHTQNETVIAYCWHDIPGLQKFGSYIGNDSNNQFVELGFRPALVWIKATTTGTTYTSWWIGDAERNKFNPTGGANTLWANLGAGEGKRGDGSTTSNLQNIDVDFLSNGFCVTGGNSDEISDATYGPFIYAAWAEAPMNNLYGAQSNAR